MIAGDEPPSRVVDVGFQLAGESVPVDHGYRVYSALCAAVPALHGAAWLGVHPLSGTPTEAGTLALRDQARLFLRLPAERIPDVLPLAGCTLEVAGSRLALGAPNVSALIPASCLDARLVILKLTEAPHRENEDLGRQALDVAAFAERYVAELARQLAALNIQSAPELCGRRSITVSGKRIVGYSVRVAALRADSEPCVANEWAGGQTSHGVRCLPGDEGHMNDAAPARLLAKSKRGTKELTLLQHLRDTERAATSLFRPGTRWARTYPRFFKLEPEQHEAFLLHLRLAALFHDIGKANEDFQDAMTARSFKPQSLRHEHLSALVLCEPSIASWLLTNPAVDVDIVVAAVLSHHLKAAESGEWEVLLPRHATPTALFLDDNQVLDAFRRVAEVAALVAFPGVFPAARYLDAAWTPAWDALFERAARFASHVRKDPARLRLSLAVKAGLIVCDSVSSGLWREEHDIDAWVEAVAHSAAIAPDDIDAHVLNPRKEELGKKWQGWHGFQTGAASVGRRGLLLAACGSGKTLAAWRWAAAISQREEIGRVIFLYPTRGTATEGFRDYVAHAPEGHSALVHGTSAYELAGMMANPEESPASLKGKTVVADESEARLFALGLWSKRYFSATVDQFLGFIEHTYGGLCLLPALADSAVVFDEVHSYDPKMWNALVTFLERFDLPVLCMTATLPPTRRHELEKRCALQSYPTPSDMHDLADLAEKEAAPRYRIQASTEDHAVNAAVAAVGEGHRVLWVVNTVRRCQQLGRALKLRLGSVVPVGVYHSRFRLEDRQQRHRETIDAFRAPVDGEPAPAIAITTQVCEMSLDLDADLLITEHAPISSLVQRFGRANRHLRRGVSFRATLLTYAPESSAPYEKREIEVASRFLSDLGQGDVSQRDLALGLEKHALAERHASGSTAFIHGGYFATAGALRDSDDIGAAVVLDGDIERFKYLTRHDRPTDGLRLTIPKKHARAGEGSGLPLWLMTADSARYDPWLGFVVDEESSHT